MAAKRMATSSRAAASIIGFVQDVRNRGFQEAAKAIGIGDLVGKPVGEAVAQLVEAFCLPGGGIDEAITRRAWDQTLLDAVEQGVTDFDGLTTEQWGTLVQSFIVYSIEARIFADIGTESIPEATSVQRIDELQRELHDLISGAVLQAIDPMIGEDHGLSQAALRDLSDAIYQQTFAYLSALGEE